MMRILIKIEYVGSNYHGWQKQANLPTIQGILEKTLSNFLKQNITLFGCGRTDAKVHAKSQYAHFDCESSFDFSRLPLAINNMLPKDIMIVSARQVSNDFHARFSAKKKIYRYYIYNNIVRSPLLNEFSLHVPVKLDNKKMKKACKMFVGEHNFTAFCTKREFEDRFFNVRKIYSLKMKKRKNLICFEICGNGFLYNMVRIIIGTILDVGKNKIETKQIKKMFVSKNRCEAGETLPPHGLILYDVIY